MPDSTVPGSAAAGSAMQRAVVAERDARQAIADEQAAAAAAIETARAEARAILDGVPGRIERLRARGARVTERAIAEIQVAEAAAMRALGDSALPAPLLAPATQSLAARLTGGESE
jgi:F0F1-type ATP synthase membrane subunit b/b'